MQVIGHIISIETEFKNIHDYFYYVVENLALVYLETRHVKSLAYTVSNAFLHEPAATLLPYRT